MIANRELRAAAGDLGLEIVEKVARFIRERHGPPGDDEQLSQELGRVLVSAVFLAGDDVEWLNRVFVAQGLGMALGEVVGAFPNMRAGFVARLNNGFAEGEAHISEALRPVGEA